MKRIMYMVIRNIILVPFMWIKLCYHASHVDKYTEEEHYKMIKFIDRRANKGGNVHIDIHGLENIPKENGFMFFPNHQGLYDVLAILEACPVPFSVVAKKEVSEIPFLKQVFACMRAYMLDREDVRQALKIINNVAGEVEKGRNYLIFPEGTRSKNGNRIGEFKGGSFKSATKSAICSPSGSLIKVCRNLSEEDFRKKSYDSSIKFVRSDLLLFSAHVAKSTVFV